MENQAYVDVAFEELGNGNAVESAPQRPSKGRGYILTVYRAPASYGLFCRGFHRCECGIYRTTARALVRAGADASACDRYPSSWPSIRPGHAAITLRAPLDRGGCPRGYLA